MGIGVEPFAEARGEYLGIDSGIENPGQQPLLTWIACVVFHFFGHGTESLMIFSVVPYMLSIFLIAVFIARKWGRVFGLIGGVWLAFQPTFLAWSSVPSTVPLASCIVLLLVSLAGQSQRWAPWVALVASGILAWGVSPLVTVVMPICWIEGCRREVEHRWNPGGWLLFWIGTLGLLCLQAVGGDLGALASSQSGIAMEFGAVSRVSMIAIDPGMVLLLMLTLVAGFRKTVPRLRPLVGLLVTAILPWLLAGELPVFPLVVLIPSALWLVVETFVDRSRVKVLDIHQVGRGIREAFLFFLCFLFVGGIIFASQETGIRAAATASLFLAVCIVGALVGLRSGMRRTAVTWAILLSLVVFLIPINLNRLAHSTNRWELARANLDRLVPPGEAISGPWAHMLVLGTDRPAYQNQDLASLEVSIETSPQALEIEKYHLFGKSFSLFRTEGEPQSLFEEAVLQHSEGDMLEARKSLSLILRKTPGCSAAWERLAMILMEDGHEDLAAECFFFALQEDPWRPVSHQQLARLYSLHGFFREVRFHLEMSRGPEPGEPLFAEANALVPNRR